MNELNALLNITQWEFIHIYEHCTIASGAVYYNTVATSEIPRFEIMTDEYSTLKAQIYVLLMIMIILMKMKIKT